MSGYYNVRFYTLVILREYKYTDKQHIKKTCTKDAKGVQSFTVHRLVTSPDERFKYAHTKKSGNGEDNKNNVNFR